MNIHNFVNRKNIIILASVLVVAVCVIVAVAASMGREYQMVEVSQPGSSEPQQSSEPEEQSTAFFKEENGISITAQTDLPETLEPLRYVKQAYELKYLMAVDSFSSVNELPVSPVVQYAFCYLYANGGCLVDYKAEAMTYRQATEEEIKGQILSLFGACPFEVRDSELYSSGKQYFEMWQPDYSDTIYASANLRKIDEESYQMEISYYEDAGKTKTMDTTVITVKKGDADQFYLASMT